MFKINGHTDFNIKLLFKTLYCYLQKLKYELLAKTFIIKNNYIIYRINEENEKTTKLDNFCFDRERKIVNKCRNSFSLLVYNFSSLFFLFPFLQFFFFFLFPLSLFSLSPFSPYFPFIPLFLFSPLSPYFPLFYPFFLY